MTMSSAEAEEAAAVAYEEVRRHWSERRVVVKELARFLHVPQVEIARILHMSRQTLNTRLNGTTKFEPWELAAIAAFLNVPRELMDGTPRAAFRYVLDHPEEFPSIRWSPSCSLRAV